MDDALWNKVFAYVSTVKYRIPDKEYICDKVLRKKVAETFIVNKFLMKWIDRPDLDPIDILDDMLLTYYLWKQNAIEKNNNELLKIYDIYIKTLIGVKKYVLKEMIQ